MQLLETGNERPLITSTLFPDLTQIFGSLNASLAAIAQTTIKSITYNKLMRRFPMNKRLSKFQRFPLIISATILLSVLLLFSFPSLAKVNSQPIPRIEIIESSSAEIPPAYRLIISQLENTVYVFCPTGFEPELSYVRNVKAIRCQRLPAS
jgi:hypothetical protein